MSRWRCGLAGLWIACACTNFPSIESGVCGNGIVDAPQEDCDNLDAKSSCRPKGTEGECHFDCATANGHGTSCPPGWGCDSSAICRAPRATFALPTSWLDVDAWSLTAGDFDPYLLARGPGNFSADNDDDPSERGSKNSRLDLTLPADGEYRFVVTSYRPGESGAYTLSMQDAGGAAVAAAASPRPAPGAPYSSGLNS